MGFHIIYHKLSINLMGGTLWYKTPHKAFIHNQEVLSSIPNYIETGMSSTEK